MSVGAALAVFSLAFVLAFGLTPVAIWVGKRWRIVAVAGGRRRHCGEVVRIGGLGLYPAFCAAALASLALDVPRGDPLEPVRLTGTLLGMSLVWVMGLLDDRYSLPPWAQMAGLVAASGVAILFRVFIEVFNNPVTDSPIWVEWYLMVPITIVWIVGMTGTLNVLDGLDGLATGVTAIAALVLFLHMLRLGQHSVALLPLALVGCCLGFLPYNYSPARIFLGGGAYLLGYALGTLSIIAGAKVASALLVLWLPILDLVWQIYARWRRGQPMSLGDRGHLHFRLLDMGWPQGRIVLGYYVITASLGGIALFSPSRLLKLAALLVAGVLITVVLSMLRRSIGDETATGR